MSLRSIVTSMCWTELAAATAGAVALSLAFPKTNATWLAPFAAAALFWSWQNLSWKAAFAVGWFAATVFFVLDYIWFGATAGALLGNWAFMITFGPALGCGFYVAIAAAMASVAYAHASRALAPLAAAAAFTLWEWLRSIGSVGVPFGQIGYTQAGGTLAPLAAYGGSFGVTFAVCAFGAYLADAVHARSVRRLGIVTAALAACTAAAWLGWPARHAPPATFPVAAIQGNIPQSLKFSEAASRLAIERYVALTRSTAAMHPRIVVWPETVVTTILARDVRVEARLGALAREMRTTLVTGSFFADARAQYNAAYVFSPSGTLSAIYLKRQLVPYAEGFPAKRWLSWIPGAHLISDFGKGEVNGVYAASGMQLAPLICWESAFADLANAQANAGASVFAIMTDDAWFGETAGPYAHAEIARMRALESGRWIIRAASTGISGIIAPDGRYVTSAPLDRQAAVIGNIGRPADTLFAHIGPTRVLAALTFLYLAILCSGALLRRA